MYLKMPYGISNYEKIVSDGYYYVDKTKYIEKLENLWTPYIMFFRPSKFGKTLFTSVLENYYDKNKSDKFDELFGNTYIGKNPTELRNKYCILKFDFSQINTSTEETTMADFKNETIKSIEIFKEKYHLNFLIDTNSKAESILNDFFWKFEVERKNEAIYVIIDGYDKYASELLELKIDNFDSFASKNKKVRYWYEILKVGTEKSVSRIFITGTAPITLDGLTSGFNKGSDITLDKEFNDMLGFSDEELKQILENEEIDEVDKKITMLKENYGGYKFNYDAQNKVCNPSMIMYFLSKYKNNREIPDKLIDTNIGSDYRKIERILKLYDNDYKLKNLIEQAQTDCLTSYITGKFNPEIEFSKTHMISMLFYLGYLTISGEFIGIPKFTIPNRVIEDMISFKI